MQIVARGPQSLELAPLAKGAAHNWFAGLLTNLPVGAPVTLAIDMTGQDTRNKVDVGKWKGLHPVLSYADPSRPDTYFSYQRRADGTWESDDPLAAGRAREAGNGPTPLQKLIPQMLAPAFLGQEKRANPARENDPKAPATLDVQTWSAWRKLSDVEADTKTNRFLIRESFALPYATVAMRVPYTPLLHQRLVQRLEAAQPRHLWVDHLGQTPGGKELTVPQLSHRHQTRRRHHHLARPTAR